MRLASIVASASFVVVALVLSSPAALAAADTVIYCPQLLDVEAGKVLGEHTILVEGERIASVKKGFVEAGDDVSEVVRLDGHTCLPGLIDSHTHLTSEFSATGYGDRFRLNPADYAIRSTVYARRTLEAGFTTVRNLGDGGLLSIALRDAIDQGFVPGPRIFSAGQSIGTTGGHGDPTAGQRLDLQGDPGMESGIFNGPDEAWKVIRQHYKNNVDVIKIMPSGGVLDESRSGDNPQMTLEEIEALVAASRDYGFSVAAHAHGAEAIRRAVEGGVDSIEHGTHMDDEGMKLMKKHGTWFVPTIIAGEFVAQQASENPEVYPPQVARKALEIGPKILETAGRAYKAGVKIAFGTDAGVYPHGENAHEFELMVEAGMPPMYAIQAATTHAAELLGRDEDVGSLTAGKYADIIAVPGNPVDDISLMKQVNFVMKAGETYKRPDDDAQD
ncbi:MAG TPA: amidohydrolase family protein [Wenzhouxiangella sp.]|nr:amidohydrolase family protein [Wenzhouxiangella sp.]